MRYRLRPIALRRGRGEEYSSPISRKFSRTPKANRKKHSPFRTAADSVQIFSESLFPKNFCILCRAEV